VRQCRCARGYVAYGQPSSAIVCDGWCCVSTVARGALLDLRFGVVAWRWPSGSSGLRPRAICRPTAGGPAKMFALRRSFLWTTRSAVELISAHRIVNSVRFHRHVRRSVDLVATAAPCVTTPGGDRRLGSPHGPPIGHPIALRLDQGSCSSMWSGLLPTSRAGPSLRGADARLNRKSACSGLLP